MSNMSCFAYEHEGATPFPFECNNAVGSVSLITGVVEFAQFGYNQLGWAAYLFTVINALALLAHIGLAVRWKTWWMLPTMAAGTAVELLGWAGRLWAYKSEAWSPHNGGFWDSPFGGFIMQIVCLVIAPTFFSAANYVLLNRLIRITGGRFSIVTPRSFTIIFIVADVVCIVIQGAGGGIAGTAETSSGADNGAYIMTAGVVLQLVITVFYVVLFGDFVHRYFTGRHANKQRDMLAPFRVLKCWGRRRHLDDGPQESIGLVEAGKSIATTSVSQQSSDSYVPEVSSSRILTMCVVLGFTTLLITVRGVYRAVELTDGWRGPIAINQGLFLGMDALLMALLTLSYIAYHPGLVVGNMRG